MAEIRLTVSSGKARCDLCVNRNFREDGDAHVYPTAIYALTIGAGYRQPSYLCPNCLGVLRLIVGPPNLFRVSIDNADRNNERPDHIFREVK